MSECGGWKLARGSKRVAAFVFILVLTAVGFILVGVPVGLSASDSPAPTPAPRGADRLDDFAAVRALTMAFKFDEAQAALDRLARAYPGDAQVAQEAWWLGIKRRITRAEGMVKQGRNVEAEAIYRGVLAESGTGFQPVGNGAGVQPALHGCPLQRDDAHAPQSRTGVSPVSSGAGVSAVESKTGETPVLPSDVVYLARSTVHKNLMRVYLDWGRMSDVDPLWSGFAADPGVNQAPYALKMGEEFREGGEFARSMAAYDLGADRYSTATTETDLKALREARIGAATAGCLVAGSGKSANDIAAVAAQAPAGEERAQVYTRAVKFLLQMKAPEKILALSQCAPDAPGRAVCRVRGLMATSDFDRAASVSLQALRAMPDDQSVAGVAAFLLQRMPASDPGDLERGRAFFDQASAVAEGDAAIRVRGGLALFLARVQGQTTSTLAVLDDMAGRFASRPEAAAKEIDRVAGEWRKQRLYSLEGQAHERLALLTEGTASLKHRREAVKALATANSAVGRVGEARAALLSFEGPGRNDALLDAADLLVDANYGAYRDQAQAACEAVLAHSPTEAQSELARVALARLEFARAAQREDGPVGEALVRDDMPSTRALRVARDAMFRGDYATARALCRLALANARSDAENAQARRGVIEAGLLCDDASEALNAAAGLSAVDPDPVHGLWNAVLNVASHGKADTAAAFCDDLASLGFPQSDLLAQTCRAIDALKKGQETDTTALRQALLALPGEGHETAATLALAEALHLARRNAEARELYERAGALTKGDRLPSLRSRAALALIEAEEGALTTAPLDAVSATLSDSIGLIAMYLAEDYIRPTPGASGPTLEQWRRRFDAYRTIARRGCDSDALMPRTLLLLGESHYLLGDPDRALGYFTLVVRRYPNHHDTPLAGQWIASVWKSKADACERACESAGRKAALREGVRACEDFARLFPDSALRDQYERQAADWRKELERIEAEEENGEERDVGPGGAQATGGAAQDGARERQP